VFIPNSEGLLRELMYVQQQDYGRQAAQLPGFPRPPSRMARVGQRAVVRLEGRTLRQVSGRKREPVSAFEDESPQT
jgi:hypothetical protein